MWYTKTWGSYLAMPEGACMATVQHRAQVCIKDPTKTCPGYICTDANPDLDAGLIASCFPEQGSIFFDRNSSTTWGSDRQEGICLSLRIWNKRGGRRTRRPEVGRRRKMASCRLAARHSRRGGSNGGLGWACSGTGRDLDLSPHFYFLFLSFFSRGRLWEMASELPRRYSAWWSCTEPPVLPHACPVAGSLPCFCSGVKLSWLCDVL